MTETHVSDRLAVSRRILIVDDNVDAAESLSMLLTLDGHQTLCVYDGRTAVAAATGPFAPEIALLDITLPDMSGYDVARILRANHGASLSLIAFTGWSQQSDKAHSLEAGFDAHVVKPVDYDALRRLLEELMAGKS